MPLKVRQLLKGTAGAVAVLLWLAAALWFPLKPVAAATIILGGTLEAVGIGFIADDLGRRGTKYWVKTLWRGSGGSWAWSRLNPLRWLGVRPAAQIVPIGIAGEFEVASRLRVRRTRSGYRGLYDVVTGLRRDVNELRDALDDVRDEVVHAHSAISRMPREMEPRVRELADERIGEVNRQRLPVQSQSVGFLLIGVLLVTVGSVASLYV